MEEKIGKVILDTTCYPGKDLYSDGAIEDEMLAISRDFAPEEFNRVISERESWPILYHFSHIRENILSWLPFTGEEKSSKLFLKLNLLFTEKILMKNLNGQLLF